MRTGLENALVMPYYKRISKYIDKIVYFMKTSILYHHMTNRK